MHAVQYGPKSLQTQLSQMTAELLKLQICPKKTNVHVVWERFKHTSLQCLIRKGWFSNTSFTTGLKTLPTFRPDALVFFRAKNVGKVFNPVVKLILENQPFLMPEPAEKPSLHAVLNV